MTHLFARLVGAEGLVYAVDINPTLLDSIDAGAAERGPHERPDRAVHGEERRGYPLRAWIWCSFAIPTTTLSTPATR